MSLRCFFPRRLIVATLPLLAATALHAMSVIAPTFDQLVSMSDTVVRGVVTDVHCITVDTPQGQAIKTLVTLQVENALKGSPGPSITLTFLGGKAGRRTLTVVGMPTFKVGERDIVFVANNGQVICPLLAAGHGRYRIERDPATNRDFVARENHAPLMSTDEISQPLDHAAASAPNANAAMTPEAFEGRITSAVRASQSLR